MSPQHRNTPVTACQDPGSDLPGFAWLGGLGGEQKPQLGQAAGEGSGQCCPDRYLFAHSTNVLASPAQLSVREQPRLLMGGEERGIFLDRGGVG